MTPLKAIILGLVQGFTEFLPISSSGHLILLERLGVGEVSLFFNVILHLGTLLSVFLVFYKQIFNMVIHPIKSDLKYIIIASIPTGIIAILVKLYGKNLLTGDFLPICFMLTACMLIFSNIYYVDRNKSLSFKNSILTGVIQGIAVLPGISRSGFTIGTMMLLGVDKQKACDFSFMLSIPIIIASAIGELIPLNINVQVELLPIMCGLCFSFLGGVISLTLLYKTISKGSFVYFGVYLILLSFILLFFY